MDGGEMYAPYYAARATKVGPLRREPAAGRADSAGPGSIRTLWFWRAGAKLAASTAPCLRCPRARGTRPRRRGPRVRAGQC